MLLDIDQKPNAMFVKHACIMYIWRGAYICTHPCGAPGFTLLVKIHMFYFICQFICFFLGGGCKFYVDWLVCVWFKRTEKNRLLGRINHLFFAWKLTIFITSMILKLKLQYCLLIAITSMCVCVLSLVFVTKSLKIKNDFVDILILFEIMIFSIW